MGTRKVRPADHVDVDGAGYWNHDVYTVSANHLGVYIDNDILYDHEVDTLIEALRAAKLYHLNRKVSHE